MITGQEIAHGSAVAGNQALEAPLIAQDLLFVACLTAAGLTIDALIGTHHLGHLAFLHQGLEGWQVGFPQIALRQLFDIKRMAVPLRTAMHSEMLGAGQQFLVSRQRLALIAIALQATHHGKSHLRGEERVFAIGFLSPTPTRVAEDIDIGRPERQTLIATDSTRLLGLLRFDAGLIADSGKHLVQQSIVPRGGHGHGDGEYGGIAITSHAMKGLVPPLELGNIQVVDGRRRVHHQAHFFFERESLEQIIGTLFGSEFWVLIREGCGLRDTTQRKETVARQKRNSFHLAFVFHTLWGLLFSLERKNEVWFRVCKCTNKK